jgi:hypothetical protein
MEISYPPTRPPISNLIDSISEDEALVCLGRLLQKFSEFLPTNVISAKSSIFFILSEMERKLSVFEKDFNALIIFYYGIKPSSDSAELWFWTVMHKELSTKILGVSDNHPPITYQILNLVSDRPSEEFIGRLKGLIHDCAERSIQISDAKSLNEYISTLLFIMQKTGSNEFGDELLKKLLSSWSSGNAIGQFPVQLSSLVHELVDAVLRKDKKTVDLTLGRLSAYYGDTPKAQEIYTSIASKQSSWWSKVDFNWWKEQD